MTEDDNIWERPDIKAWSDDVMTNMLPKMKRSAMAMTIFEGSITAKLMAEVGAAVLLDKPFILCVVKGADVPRKLRRIADEIVEVGAGSVLESPEVTAHGVRDAILRLRARGLI